MPDERQDSIRQGINSPQESQIGKQAEEERRRRAAEGPEIGGAMGGTSDADSPGDEAQSAAARYASEQRTSTSGATSPERDRSSRRPGQDKSERATRTE
jgi:hypothetical protein